MFDYKYYSFVGSAYLVGSEAQLKSQKWAIPQYSTYWSRKLYTLDAPPTPLPITLGVASPCICYEEVRFCDAVTVSLER